MKTQKAMITPFDIASFSFLKGHNQAISWVKEIGEKFFDDKPEVMKALDFITDQLAEGQKGALDHFMKTLKLETIDLKAETKKPQ